MQWYVRYEGTGEISGPMSKEEALDKAEAADGMIFSDNIFDCFSVPEDTATLIEELQGLLSSASPAINPEAVALIRRAVNMLILQSKPNVPATEVDELLAKLDSVGRAGVVIDDIAQSLMLEAIEMIARLFGESSSEMIARFMGESGS